VITGVCTARLERYLAAEGEESRSVRLGALIVFESVFDILLDAMLTVDVLLREILCLGQASEMAFRLRYD
jgi:hypothetical protein